MDWNLIIEAGMDLAGEAIENKKIGTELNGVDISKKIDTTTAGTVVTDLLSELTTRSDNNVDVNVVSFIKGMMGTINVDELIIKLLETLAKKTNNNVDDTLVKLVTCYIKKDDK